MKFAIPEISWHNRDPVLSVDFQPKAEANGPLRLATGGTDSHVLIWYISTTETGSVNLEVAADLARHQKAVNVVRWSPDGQYLASGDDESIIFIWKQKTEEVAPTPEQIEEQYKETWVIHKTLRGHMEDVLDLTWSLDCKNIASGSVDNKLLIWDVTRGKYSSILTDHKGFVQGVSWDPKGQYIATTSTDRIFRTFDINTKKVVSRSSKACLPFPKDHPLRDIKVRLYHDDTLQTFYRRLQFSPDGLFIAVPGGKIEPEQGKLDVKPINAVYIYTRYSLKVPAVVVPCGAAALVARWCARRLALRAAGPAPALPLRYRLLLAVATRRSVLVYDTQQPTPIAVVSNIHYTRLTDLTWSPDGRMLVASSTDGFCSIISFGDGELGDELPEQMDHNLQEPMDVQTVEQPEPKEKTDETRTATMENFIKFKAPTEKSPKKQNKQAQVKTPVKIDVLEEVAMPSWSDNSNNEIIKPSDTEPMDTEITVIEDSEDIKLVYDETEGSKSQSPKDKTPDKAPKNTTPDSKQSQKMTESPKSSQMKTDSPFLRQAKVTDVKQPAAGSSDARTHKPPRRVSFVTLSSPKNTKKKC